MTKYLSDSFALLKRLKIIGELSFHLLVAPLRDSTETRDKIVTVQK